MKSIIILLGLFFSSYAIYYDAFNGKPLTKKEVLDREKNDNLEWCTDAIPACDRAEGRRVDGSCTNLKYPTLGTKYTRFLRILPSVIDNDAATITKGVCGEDLPLARRVRTTLLADGKVSNQKFTHLLTALILFVASDIMSNHDTRNYVSNTTYCCEPEHFNDYECAPNFIPEDDPVFRFTDMRCLNMTRTMTYQSKGCIKKGSAPERISLTTPIIDLSVVYGSTGKLDRYRTLKGGLFKYEMVNGKPWPLSTKPEDSVCSGNTKQTETRCHDVPDIFAANSLGPINMFFIWFWRLHNFIAKKLSKVNPCWKDQKLFYAARDINIAVLLQIFYYELLPLFLGKNNLERDRIISKCESFRDIYDENVFPKLSLEHHYTLRWLHTMQESTLNMYDPDGCLVNKFPVVNQTLRTGHFFKGDNLAQLTQGIFRQACGKADYIVHPDMSNMGLGDHLRITDILANDLSKSRLFGLQPYIKYREYCCGKPVTCWKDLEDVMDPENIENLKKVYGDIRNVDLLAGVWMENHMPGSTAPYTFYCLFKEQYLRNVVSDRHWYERPNRPYAFTSVQLAEIRKINMAKVLCLVGDTVTQIQPHAFLRTGPGNKITDCSNIKGIDFTKWKDQSCLLRSQE